MKTKAMKYRCPRKTGNEKAMMVRFFNALRSVSVTLEGLVRRDKI